MSVRSFTIFPKLPQEVRDLIYTACIQPRFVPILDVSLSSSDIYSGIRYRLKVGEVTLYSPSPIPSLLHTCQESRAALIAAGYVVAFGTSRSKPRIWFNYAYDVVYLATDEVGPHLFEHQINHYKQHAIQHANGPELSLVKRVAYLRNKAQPSYPVYQSSWALPSWIPMFYNLEEVLLVKNHIDSNSDKALRKLKDDPKDLWGYVECDISLYPEQYWRPFGDASGKITHYKVTTKSTGLHYFRDEAKQLEKELPVHQSQYHLPAVAIVHDNVVVAYISRTQIPRPKVRMVVVASRNVARKRVKQRERYWNRIQRLEDEEAEYGPSMPITAMEAFGHDIANEEDFDEQQRYF